MWVRRVMYRPTVVGTNTCVPAIVVRREPDGVVVVRVLEDRPADHFSRAFSAGEVIRCSAANVWVGSFGSVQVRREALELEPVRRCFCPDDCGCRRAYRPNVCGCREH